MITPTSPSMCSGNLWEEMKDDSFNLDALGTFSNSPLRLSDCDLGTANLPPVSSGANLSLSDVQVTGLYTSYASQDALSSQYMGAPSNSKPIALLWTSQTVSNRFHCLDTFKGGLKSNPKCWFLLSDWKYESWRTTWSPQKNSLRSEKETTVRKTKQDCKYLVLPSKDWKPVWEHEC